jgi:hypothetical protein
MSQYRSLLLRANRVLGASLVEHNLVNIEHLEAANERLFEILKNGVARQASLLGILMGEMGSLSETDLLDHAIRDHGLGLVDLSLYNIPDECRPLVAPELTWATWTLPFDYEDGFYFVATSYYLSVAVRDFWQDRLQDRIIWYATSMDGLCGAVDKVAEDAKHA